MAEAEETGVATPLEVTVEEAMFQEVVVVTSFLEEVGGDAVDLLQ